MVGESNQNVFLIQKESSSFAEFEISEFEISRFDCISINNIFDVLRIIRCRHVRSTHTLDTLEGRLSYIRIRFSDSRDFHRRMSTYNNVLIAYE